MGVHLCTPITILSHHSEHFLCFLPAKLIHLPAGIFNPGYPTEFVLSVLKSEMCVSIQSNTDVAVSHKVLQRFRVHAGFRHIAAIGVAADVRRYAWHLQAVNLVVPIHHML